MPKFTNNSDIEVLNKIAQSYYVSDELKESATELKRVVENSQIKSLDSADESKVDRFVLAIETDYETEAFQCLKDYYNCKDNHPKLDCAVALGICFVGALNLS